MKKMLTTAAVMAVVLTAACGCGKNKISVESTIGANFDINKEIPYNEIELPEVMEKTSEPIGVSDLKVERTVGGKRNTDIFAFEFNVTNNAPQKERYNIRVEIATVNGAGETISCIGPVQVESAVSYGETVHVDNYSPATLVDENEKVTFEISKILVQDANLYECNEKLKEVQKYLDNKEYDKAAQTLGSTEVEYNDSCSEYISQYKNRLEYEGYDTDELISGK